MENIDKQELKELFTELQELIEKNDWDGFFVELQARGYKHEKVTEIAKILLFDIGIPVFDYMTTIPPKLFLLDRDPRLSTLVLPKNIRIIEEYAFANSSVKEVIIEGAYEIDNQAFSTCENLEKVYIGDNIQTLGFEVFSHNLKLKDVEIASTQELSYVSSRAFVYTPVYAEMRNILSPYYR